MRVLLVLLVVLAAGCTVAVRDPNEVAHEALDALIVDLTSADGDLSRMEGTMSAQGYGVPFTLEIARDGTRHFNLSVAGFAIDAYCRGDEVVRVIDGEPREARPGTCPLDGARFGDPAAALRQMTLVEAHREDAFIRATFEANITEERRAELDEDDPQGGGNLTILTDRKPRAAHVWLTSPGGTMEAELHYGRRSSTGLPDTNKRLAAAIEADDDFDDGRFEWRVDDDPSENVSWSELEARVLSPLGQEVARLSLAPGERNESGFVVTVTDEDEDGIVDENERFTLARADWLSRSQYTVTVYDAWAGEPIVERRIPDVVATALAGIALAAYAFSRQRG